jgi:hypothetical protein
VISATFVTYRQASRCSCQAVFSNEIVVRAASTPEIHGYARDRYRVYTSEALKWSLGDLAVNGDQSHDMTDLAGITPIPPRHRPGRPRPPRSPSAPMPHTPHWLCIRAGAAQHLRGAALPRATGTDLRRQRNAIQPARTGPLDT